MVARASMSALKNLKSTDERLEEPEEHSDM
jgi:hypothetical protein